MKYLLSALLLFVGCCSWALENKAEIPALQRELLFGYDKRIRPVKNHNHTTVVQFGLALNNLEVNERTQSMSIYAWLIIQWEDEYLKWNKEEYGDLDRVHFSPEQIWLPDVSLYNSINKDPTTLTSPVPLIVTHKGNVLWFPPFWGEVPCELDLENFPRDSHMCTFQFRAWTHRGQLIHLGLHLKNHSSGIILDGCEQNSRWLLVSATANKTLIEEGSDELIAFHLAVQRKNPKIVSYVMSSVFALILVVVFSYGLPLRFHLSRILFHVITLLLFMLSALGFLLYLPLSSGRRTPVIVNYYFRVIVITTVSLVANVLLTHNWFTLTSSKCLGGTLGRDPKNLTFSPFVRRLTAEQEEEPYNEIEETEPAENETTLVQEQPPSMNPRRVLILQIVNFVVAFTFTICFLVVHYELKSSVL